MYAPDFVSLFGFTGAHDDWQYRRNAGRGDRAGQLKTILAGYDNVHQDQPGRETPSLVRKGLRRSRCANGVATFGQKRQFRQVMQLCLKSSTSKMCLIVMGATPSGAKKSGY
jgi:hypothetical protein